MKPLVATLAYVGVIGLGLLNGLWIGTWGLPDWEAAVLAGGQGLTLGLVYAYYVLRRR